MAGIDWHRLALRKNAFFCRIRCTYAPINQPNISKCSSRQELSFELIVEKQLVELRAGGQLTFFVLHKKIGSPFHEYVVSGASSHMTNDATKMYSVRSVSPDEAQITISDGTRRKVTQIGNIVVFHGRTDEPITLCGVSYVPGLGFNPFSFHKAQETHIDSYFGCGWIAHRKKESDLSACEEWFVFACEQTHARYCRGKTEDDSRTGESNF